MKNARPIGIWKLAHRSSGTVEVGAATACGCRPGGTRARPSASPSSLARAGDRALHEVQQVAVVARGSWCRTGRRRSAVSAGGLALAPTRRCARGRLLRQAAQPRRPSEPACARRRASADLATARLRRRWSSVAAHGASATLTWPCSRSSGTGSSWMRSSSIERPARGRKKERPHCGQASAPSTQRAVVEGAAAAAQTSR